MKMNNLTPLRIKEGLRQELDGRAEQLSEEVGVREFLFLHL